MPKALRVMAVAALIAAAFGAPVFAQKIRQVAALDRSSQPRATGEDAGALENFAAMIKSPLRLAQFNANTCKRFGKAHKCQATWDVRSKQCVRPGR